MVLHDTQIPPLEDVSQNSTGFAVAVGSSSLVYYLRLRCDWVLPIHRTLSLFASFISFTSRRKWISKKAYSKSLILLANFSLHLWDLTNWIYVFTVDSYKGVRYIWPFCPMLHSHAEQEETSGKAQQRGLECQGLSPANSHLHDCLWVYPPCPAVPAPCTVTSAPLILQETVHLFTLLLKNCGSLLRTVTAKSSA